MLDPAGSYGVSLHSFFSTHAPLPQRPDHYVKVARVRAMQTREAMTLETWVDGRLEMRVEVPAGAFVVQNPGGEQYAMSADEFGRRYRPAE